MLIQKLSKLYYEFSVGHGGREADYLLIHPHDAREAMKEKEILNPSSVIDYLENVMIVETEKVKIGHPIYLGT